MRHEYIRVSMFFLVSLFIFTFGISSQEVIGFDSRFYLFALEMWRHGMSAFPTTYGQPYPDYPVTSILLINGLAKLFGTLNKFIAVLPTAMAASFTVIITYLIGALHDKRYGFYAALFLFINITFFKCARSISLDMYPTLFTAGCFYVIYSADLLKKPARIWLIFPLLALSFAFRGPIGLIIPQSVISIYYLLNRDIKKFFLTGILAAILLALCTYGLLTLARHAGGNDLMQRVLHMEVLGRIDNPYLPFYFYFTSGMGNYAVTFPLATLVAMGAFCMPRRNMGFLFKLIAWALIILIGMSIPGDKKIRYILAISPALALIAAYPMVNSQEKYFAILRRIFMGLFTIFPLIICLSIGFLSYYAKQHALSFNISYVAPISSLLILQTYTFVCFFALQKRPTLRDVSIVTIAVAAFIMSMLMIVEPIEQSLDQARDFVTSVETLRANQQAALVFYKERPDSLPIKYLANMTRESHPVFIDDPKQFAYITEPTFVVTSVTYFSALPAKQAAKYKIIASGKMAHVPVVVFLVD